MLEIDPSILRSLKILIYRIEGELKKEFLVSNDPAKDHLYVHVSRISKWLQSLNTEVSCGTQAQQPSVLKSHEEKLKKSSCDMELKASCTDGKEPARSLLSRLISIIYAFWSPCQKKKISD